jgi:hypothetical protein
MQPGHVLFSSSAAPSSPDALTLARRPDTVTLAAAVLGVEAVLVVLLGLQTTLMMRWNPPYDKAVYALVGLGAVAAALGLRVARVAPRFQKVAIFGSGFIAAAVAAWTLFSFLSGVFSLLGVLAVLSGVISTILLAGSLPACTESYAARVQLRAEGVEFNL